MGQKNVTLSLDKDTYEKYKEFANEYVFKYYTYHLYEAEMYDELINLIEGKEASPVKILLMPTAHFLINYIFRLGVLDGVQGFLFAVIMSFHSFLAWSKLFLLRRSIEIK